MSQALEVNKENFSAEVLNSSVPVLVDFWAPWCGPCKMMGPILDQLALDSAGKIKIVKVNTEEASNQDLAIEYQIQSIPNMKLFIGGQVKAEFIGLRTKESLKADIDAFLK
jgi:thioredoxin 1